MSEKLPVVRGDQLRRALERAGFVLVRIKGSAHVMRHPDTRRTVSVHIHRGETIKRGTLAAILDDAGLTVDDLRSLL
ncbi:MAG: type II toxin-antitoxin system HicA family toxin [Candidatus Eremiobacteraeota bacterium]|nr:type II toxin-antitoxin system HicA family toxin [Candidatus Eremiobacteraeota bacterium]MBV8644069.1 type II toxin-antitoxin system HicA family toxin [Candidatus Eremiobacteraeota bacterium]